MFNVGNETLCQWHYLAAIYSIQFAFRRGAKRKGQQIARKGEQNMIIDNTKEDQCIAYVTSQFGMHPNPDWDSHPNLEF